MTFKAMLRPVIEDAAQSLDYAYGLDPQRVRDWFDSASDEWLQHQVMGRVQDAVLEGLGLTRDDLGG